LEKSNNLSNAMVYLSDSTGLLKPTDIVKTEYDSIWKQLLSDYLQFGYRVSYHWIRLDLTTKEVLNDRLFWYFEDAIAQDVQFHLLKNNQIIESDTFGVDYPFDKRNIKHRYSILAFNLHPSDTVTLLLRLHNDIGSISGKMILTTETEFFINDEKDLGIWIFLFTLWGISMVLSFSLWLIFKEAIYGFYLANLVCITLRLMNGWGFLHEWFFFDTPILVLYSKIIWLLATTIFSNIFIEKLLFSGAYFQKWVHRTIQAITWIASLSLLLIIVIPTWEVTAVVILIANFLIIFSSFLCFSLIIYALFKKNPVAPFALAAYSLVIFTSVLSILRNYGFVQDALIQSKFMTSTGLLVESAVMFLAMLKRFNVWQDMKKEQLEMERNAQIRLQIERERISRDLHDNVGAQLSHMVSNIDWIAAKNNGNGEQGYLDEMSESAKMAILNLRETIWALHQDTISVEAFADKFKAYAQAQVRFREGIKLVFKEDLAQEKTLTSTQALNLYRICQEALNNCLKYAEASQISLHFSVNTEGVFKIILSDNGIGFDTKKVNGESYGLNNISYRTQEIGGQLNIESVEKKGTSLRIVLP
jgi:two-component system, sensor histidine kinase LadS